MKKLIIYTLLLIFGASANAGGVKNTNIAMIQAESDGSFYVFFSGGDFTAPPPSCSYPNLTQGYTLYRLSATVGQKAIYATALTAMTANLKVEIAGTGSCEFGYETIRGILVQQASGFTY